MESKSIRISKSLDKILIRIKMKYDLKSKDEVIKMFYDIWRRFN